MRSYNYYNQSQYYFCCWKCLAILSLGGDKHLNFLWTHDAYSRILLLFKLSTYCKSIGLIFTLYMVSTMLVIFCKALCFRVGRVGLSTLLPISFVFTHGPFHPGAWQCIHTLCTYWILIHSYEIIAITQHSSSFPWVWPLVLVYPSPRLCRSRIVGGRCGDVTGMRALPCQVAAGPLAYLCFA